MFKTTNCLQRRISRTCGAEVESYNRRPPQHPYREDDTLPLACDTQQETGRVSRKPQRSEHPSRQKKPVLHVTWRLMGAFPGWSPGYQSRISLGSPLLICFCFSKPSLQAFKPFQIGKALTLKWWRVCSHRLPNFNRAQKFWLRPMWNLF